MRKFLVTRLGRGKRAWVLLSAFYLALTFLFMWPYVKPWEMASVAQTIDAVLVSQILSWGAHALITQPASYFDLNLYFPLQDALATTDHQFVPAAMSVIPRLILGPVANFHLQMVLAFWLTALSFHALARDRFGRHALALPAAAAFTFSSVRLHHMNGQLHLLAFQWTPLALLFMRRVLARGGWKNGVAFGALLFLACATGWYMALLSAMLLAVFGAADGLALARAPEAAAEKLRRLGFLAAGVSVVFLLLIPLAAPYRLMREQLPDLAVAHTIGTSGRARDYVVPPGSGPHRTILGVLLERWRPASRPPVYSQFAGWTVLALAAVGLALGGYDRLAHGRPWPRDLAAWTVLAAAAFVLSLGALKWNGQDAPIRLPLYWIYKHVSFVRFFRAPFRFCIPAMAALAMLAAFGLDRLTRNLSRRPKAFGAVCLVVTGLMLAEQFPVDAPKAAYRITKPPSRVYQTVKRDASVKAVLETPRGNVQSQLSAAVHYKPIADGASGYVPDKTARDLEAFEHVPHPLAVWRLNDRGITHVVAHEERRALLLAQSAFFERIDSSNGDFLFRLAEAGRGLRLEDLLPVPPKDAPASIVYSPRDAPRWAVNRSMKPFAWKDGGAESRIVGPDPFFALPCQPFPLSSVDTLEVEAAIAGDIAKKDRFTLYFGLADDRQLSQTKSAARLIRTDGEYHLLVFDLNETFSWQAGGVGVALRLDPGEDFPGVLRIKRIEFRRKASNREER